jgi:hypothetical protein
MESHPIPRVLTVTDLNDDFNCAPRHGIIVVGTNLGPVFPSSSPWRLSAFSISIWCISWVLPPTPTAPG